jgi:hypothetical protein
MNVRFRILLPLSLTLSAAGIGCADGATSATDTAAIVEGAALPAETDPGVTAPRPGDVTAPPAAAVDDGALTIDSADPGAGLRGHFAVGGERLLFGAHAGSAYLRAGNGMPLAEWQLETGGLVGRIGAFSLRAELDEHAAADILASREGLLVVALRDRTRQLDGRPDLAAFTAEIEALRSPGQTLAPAP